MIGWHGWGIVPLLAPGLAVIGAEALAKAIGGPNAWATDPLVYAGPLVSLSGVIVLAVGLWLEQRHRPRILISKETGEEFVYEVRHELFWIPIKFWGVLYIVAGALAFVAGLLGMTP